MFKQSVVTKVVKCSLHLNCKINAQWWLLFTVYYCSNIFLFNLQQEIEAALEKICSILPTTVQDDCVRLVKDYAGEIIDLLVKGFSPDMVCQKIGACTSQVSQTIPGPQCALCTELFRYLAGMISSNSTEVSWYGMNMCVREGNCWGVSELQRDVQSLVADPYSNSFLVGTLVSSYILTSSYIPNAVFSHFVSLV